MDEVDWTDDLTIRAVAWLSQVVSRGVLKLTMRDYAEHKLSALVAKWGSPGEVNGFVFNALGARIRGRSKLPRGQRVVCFSPHPDDDVISMGGILRKGAPVIMAVTFVFSCLVILFNLTADVLYGWLDPRISY